MRQRQWQARLGPNHFQSSRALADALDAATEETQLAERRVNPWPDPLFGRGSQSMR